MTGWTEHDIPSLHGRRAVVTGGTSGIGRATATGLAAAGAEVIVAGRDPARGAEAMRQIAEHAPGASVCFERLDLACLASVASFAARVAARHDAVDILVNDAGVMALPQRRVTADGFEMQFGVNHLGHFALTALLLPLLRRAPAARVVGVTSLSHRMGRIDFDDLQAARCYAPWKAYSQSKLAVLMFVLELQRRSDAAGWGLTSVAAHPGWAMTNLYSNGPASEGTPPFLTRMMRLGTRVFSHSAVRGAGPILFAATSPTVHGGSFHGRRWLWEMRGPPAPARIAPQARDVRVAQRLWEVSARLTGKDFGSPVSRGRLA
ncbi:SDR family oxidoreductase [Roseomonas frigidaquae]|uniref:SDR family oxidoreductase n=1 Tax=Falsiroseomonas frigidaquae TaxID=487318 RepID=A0ABX1F1M2_9PROT|nr:SDR family oxidoreductase [Falsiroseomonas frigidaquae]NKE46242.1 SDR family oxidoreductase [Falsiroseomonas frigidaquae]